MIAVDTSALIAILEGHPVSEDCRRCLAEADLPLMSAGTYLEASIVARRRGAGAQLETLVRASAIRMVAVDESAARFAADAYDRFGKGVHPAGLNLGDCFAYALASTRNCPLLYVGNDFAKTDIRSALA